MNISIIIHNYFKIKTVFIIIFLSSSILLNSPKIKMLIKSDLYNNIYHYSYLQIDHYENFLYFESGTYSWPNSNSDKPYDLYATSSVQAKTWLGSEDSNNT